MSEKSIARIFDHQSMKLNNQLTILRQIRDRGPITRVDLRERTRLSWGTITSTIKELLGKGVIKEIGSITTSVGRRPIELEMNTERNFVLGLQLGGGFVRSSLVDVKGKVAEELDALVNPRGSRQEILNCLISTGKRILKKHSVEPSDLVGIGIATPGPVDFRTGFCLYAPLHPKWKNVPLKKIFEQKFGVPCFVDHDCNCFALSEKLFGFGRDLEDFLCILLGEGVSAGIVINGEVYRGSECFSGEFGHTCIEMNGPECACGNTGCLETYISGSALARIAEEEVRQHPESRILAIAGGNAEKITAETLCLAAQQGDALAANLFKRMGVYLGVGVANLINLFNPARVILVGRLIIAYRFFLPTFFETLEKRAWHASTRDVSISGLERGAVMGAAALVLQEAFTSGLIVRRKA